jgi:hypothetical protein
LGAVAPLLSFLLMTTAGWVHRYQLIVIEFLQAENRLLKAEHVAALAVRFGGYACSLSTWQCVPF